MSKTVLNPQPNLISSSQYNRENIFSLINKVKQKYLKESVNQKGAKFGGGFKTVKYSGVKYLGGLPSYPKKGGVRVTIDESKIVIYKWGKKRAYIPISDIQDVKVIQYLDLLPPKKVSKSVVGRAMVGGLLLGPVGAVVGGITGVRQKDDLTLGQEINKNEWVVVIECLDQSIQSRCAFIFNALIMKRRMATKIQEKIQSLRSSNSRRSMLEGNLKENNLSLEVRLTKIKSLYEGGYITQNEYKSRREKIIESI